MGTAERKLPFYLQAQSKALAPPPPPRPLPYKTRPILVSDPQKCHRQMVNRAPGSRGAPEGREEAPPMTQCYKNGLVVGGLEANGLDEDPVMKGLVDVPDGWLSCLCPSLADPKSLKEEPFCC